MLGENAQALRFHEDALELFRRLRSREEIARTKNATIQPLLLLGEYSFAVKVAKEAKRLFKALGDERHVAYVETNLGNIYHRQDRFEEAVACYKRAYRNFLREKDEEGLAIAFSNMSSCLVGLNDFQRALRIYKRARQLSAHLRLTTVVVHADFNVAYLYYLRGEYTRSIALLQTVRAQSEAAGDAHILALTHLVLSEIYVELNLSTEAIETAQYAAEKFRTLGMHYEHAKALCNEALGVMQCGQTERALQLFGESRELFVRERNPAWPQVIDLYCADILKKLGRIQEAKQLVSAATPALQSAGFPSKAALGLLLWGQLDLAQKKLERAQKRVHLALNWLEHLPLPILKFQAQHLLGSIQMEEGKDREAFSSFEEARCELESLRSALQKDDLKINFIKGKTDLYEFLVALCLRQVHPQATPEKMFECMEMAKSRSLMELIQTRNGKQKEVAGPKLDELRRKIHSHYRQIEIEQMRSTGNSDRLPRLRSEASELEKEYLRRFRGSEAATAGRKSADFAKVASLRKVQENLSPSTAILEYFTMGESLVCATLRKDRMEITMLGEKDQFVPLIEALSLQLSKFRLGEAYLRDFGDILRESIQAHLFDLYTQLVRPTGDFADCEHLVIIPHGYLHNLPFHALYDGTRHLIERLKISYAPSASIHSITSRIKPQTVKSSLVMGIPDAIAPLIRDEAKAIARILPGADLYLGKNASEQVLRSKSQHRQIIHIATHGHFRADNPIFSTIKLGQSYINLCDLYELELPVDLITLSGCGTGLNLISAGDEHVGLTRGFLSAGARSLLLSLWDVNDRSTQFFMEHFYQAILNRMSKGRAYQQAMTEVMRTFPHPYYWAPFILVGNAA
jgi:CHAT domain-containing protein/tetratricopeptide (TPR) repeat protein